MIQHVVEFDGDGHKYVLDDKEGKIGYENQDQVVFNATVGYMTMFAYYKENRSGGIKQSVLDENKYILVDIAEFSYAETPLEYDIILGVTGTLDTLSDQQKSIITDKFRIHHSTYSPSVHVGGNLSYNKNNDVKILW